METKGILTHHYDSKDDDSITHDEESDTNTVNLRENTQTFDEKRTSVDNPVIGNDSIDDQDILDILPADDNEGLKVNSSNGFSTLPPNDTNATLVEDVLNKDVYDSSFIKVENTSSADGDTVDTIPSDTTNALADESNSAAKTLPPINGDGRNISRLKRTSSHDALPPISTGDSRIPRQNSTTSIDEKKMHQNELHPILENGAVGQHPDKSLKRMNRFKYFDNGRRPNTPDRNSDSPRRFLRGKKTSVDSVAQEYGNSNTIEQDEISNWIYSHFRNKSCVAYVPDQAGNDEICHCGKLQYDHPNSYRIVPGTWSSTVHTSKRTTNAFGLISFVKGDVSNQQDINKAEYLRLSDDTDTGRVAEMLHKAWGLKDPKLIISVVGGHITSALTETIQEVFEGGIGKVLGSADVWLLTGGTNIGYSKTVAEVFQGEVRNDRLHRNACIGVVPWGCIKHRDILINNGGLVTLNVANKEIDEETARSTLDFNHTHFLLVDNGSILDHEFQHRFRINLQKYYAERGVRSLPSITILLEGGLSSVNAMHAALTSQPRVPILVVQGSGRVADVVADCLYSYTKSISSGRRSKGINLFQLISTKLVAALGVDVKHERTVAAANLIKECIEDHHSHIIIYNFKKEGVGLHQALLQACRAGSDGKDDMFSSLQLAMLWDEVDIAKQDFSKGDLGNEYLYRVLMKSLVAEKADFVNVIITGQKVDLNAFLSEDMLSKLYIKKIKKGQSLIGSLLTNKEEEKFTKNKKFHLKTIDRLLRSLLDEDYTVCYRQSGDRKRLITPAQELIIWSVLNNMKEMALKLLELDSNHLLGNCLVVRRLYHALAEEIEEESTRVALTQDCRCFSEMALGLLSHYYQYDAESASMLVQEKILLWGNNSIITLAANMEFMAFVAHACCQRILDDEWNGKTMITGEIWLEKIKRGLRSKSRRKREIPFLHDTSLEKEDETFRSRRCPSFRRSFVEMARFLFVVPKGKMYLHVLIYLVFLGLFSYHVLVRNSRIQDRIEWVLLVLVIALAIDEIRQIADVRKKTGMMKIKEWAENVWNLLDAASLALYFTGFTLSYYDSGSGKIINSTALLIFVLKLLQFYRTNEYLGPYVVMISRMLKNMVGFILVLIVVILAFGIYMAALLFPNESPSWKILMRVIFRPFLLIFGEVDIDVELSDKMSVFGTAKVNENSEIVVIVATCLYLLFANVLLLNLLIAVFNNIYEQVKKHSNEIWKFEKYDMIREFQLKPLLPVPFSIYENSVRLCKKLIRKCCPRLKNAILAQDHETQEMDYELLDYERRCIRKYWSELETKKTASSQESIATLNVKLEKTATSLQELQLNIDRRLDAIERSLRKLTHVSNIPGSPRLRGQTSSLATQAINVPS